MKRLGNIFDFLTSEENLKAAHEDLMRISRKRRKAQAIAFSRNLEKNIRELHEALRRGGWIMKDYTSLTRREGGKVREIWYDNRYSSMVVQHAIGRTIGAYLTDTFIKETYASIVGRGIHRAVKHIRRHLKTYAEDSPIYIFKCDIRHVADLFIRNRSPSHRERLASYWGWLKHSTGGLRMWHNKLKQPITQLKQSTEKRCV